MARPKTRSDSVSFRLPQALWDTFVAQAKQDGLTLYDYAETIVRRHVQQRQAQQRQGRKMR